MVGLLSLGLLRTSVDEPPRGDARSATTPTPTRGSSGHLRVLGSTTAVAVTDDLTGFAAGLAGTERTAAELNSRRRANMQTSRRRASRCDRAAPR